MLRLFVLLGLVGLVVPAIASAFWTVTTTSALIFGIAALGVALLYGQLRMMSLCQVGLMGVGGWVTLRLGYATDLPFLALVALSGLSTMLVGMLVGLPALRLSGLYLGLLTLMAAAAAEVVFLATGFPEGGSGFLGRSSLGGNSPLPRPAFATSDGAYLRLCAAFALVAFLLAAVHLRTRPGRAWAAIGQSKPVAQSLGVNTTLYTMWGFALSSLFAGIAGALLAGSVGTLDVNLFPASDSVVLFAVVLICGASGVWGALLAAVFAKVLPAAFDQIGINGNLALVLFGLGVLHMLTTAPEGLTGMLRQVRLPESLRSTRPARGAP